LEEDPYKEKIILNLENKGVKVINSHEEYVANILFKNRILTLKGQAFEDFFVSVMRVTNKNFKPVKSYGRLGDEKNDGFDYSTGTYYQIFAPEYINKEKTIWNGVKKLGDDFEGLYEQWNDICPIKKFYFAINDKFEGVPALIHKKVMELRAQDKFHDIQIEIFDAKDLEVVFNSLTLVEKQQIVGFIPNQSLPIIEYDALTETVNYLMNCESDFKCVDKLSVPDFDKKILFNKLSETVKIQLTSGSYQEGYLIDFFNSKPGIKESLQNKFRMLYEEAKKSINDEVDNLADLRFYYILEKASVNKRVAVQTSVLICMAYYFSSCDIFEKPVSK